MNDLPDFIAIALENHSRQQAISQMTQDRQDRFVKDLGNEELATFGLFLTVTLDGGQNIAAYWRGRVDQELRNRGVCPGCGVDHLSEEMEGLAVKADPHEAMAVVPPVDYTAVPSGKDWDQPTLFEESADNNILENARLWNVEFFTDFATSGPVICLGCGTQSPSLEDRMLREPGVDGCSTCQQKAKWG